MIGPEMNPPQFLLVKSRLILPVALAMPGRVRSPVSLSLD